MKTTASKDDSLSMKNAACHSCTAQKKSGEKVIPDNRSETEIQMKMADTIQRSVEDEEELMQGKFLAQRQSLDEEEELQG